MTGKSFLAGLILIVLVVAGAFASGGNETSSGQGATGAASPTVVTGITINNLDQAYEPLISEIEAAGTWVYELENVDFNDLDVKINLFHASGNDYDMILVNNSSIPQFYGAGVLAPLDDYVAASGIEIDEYYNDSAVATATIDGQLFAIPYSPDCRVLAYNKNVLQSAGVEPPQTFDDVLPTARAVTGDGTFAFARDFAPLSAVYNEGSFMLGMGGHVYVRDGDGYRATVDTPEVIDFVEWMQEFQDYVAPDVNLSQDQRRELFIQDRLAFYMFGPWEFNLSIGQSLTLGEDYDLMLVPGRDHSGSAIGGFYFGLGSGADAKDGAWELIATILEPENQGPATISLPSDSRAYAYAPFNTPEFEVFNKQMETAEIPMPPTAQFVRINEVFSEYLNRAVLDGMDAAEAMAIANARIQDLLDDE